MKINLIRHGMTAGNLKKRYIGRTDESLCDLGIEQIKSRNYPLCQIVAVSPMKRCIETAKLIYPDITPIFRNDLRECDFGDFEGMNYKELSNNVDFQRWVDSGDILGFPNGESIDCFKQRCIANFLDLIKKVDDDISIITHGGTISAILENLAMEKRNFYEWSVANGEGYIVDFDGSNLIITGEI